MNTMNSTSYLQARIASNGFPKEDGKYKDVFGTIWTVKDDGETIINNNNHKFSRDSIWKIYLKHNDFSLTKI